jgi:hypothetical protein
MSGAALDDPRYISVLRRYYKWIRIDQILPTKGDLDSLNAEADNTDGGSTFLHRGYFAVMNIGRWHFATTRFLDTNISYRAVASPHGGFPVSTASARLMGLYKGSKNKELAKWFFKWIMSHDYQKMIVDDADADPPAIQFVDSPKYQKPPEFPNEWAFSASISRIFKKTALAPEYSPYVQPWALNRKMASPMQLFTLGIISAEACANEQAKGINAVILDHLLRHPELKSKYESALRIQAEIDELKSKGKKIPLGLVENPFHQAYYRHTGEGI